MTSSIRRTLVIALGLLTGGPVLAADKLTLFQNLSPISGVTIIAKSQGMFEKQGLDVEVRNVTSGKLALDAVLGGSAQLATTSEVPIMRATLAEQALAVIATMEASDNDVQFVVRKDRHIAAVKDLAGKKIATAIGTSAEYLVVAALETAGTKTSDIKLVNLRPEDMATALSRGDIDGYAIWEPHVYNGLKLMDGQADRLGTKGAYRETFDIIGMRTFVAKNPKIIESFLRALIEAETFIAQKPAEASAIIADAVGMDRSTFLGIRDNFDFHIGLDASLAALMKKQAAWDIAGGKSALVSDVSRALDDVIVIGPLKAVAPDRVRGF